jgi:hypothetical protein
MSAVVDLKKSFGKGKRVDQREPAMCLSLTAARLNALSPVQERTHDPGAASWLTAQLNLR